jgi:SOS response regulatory protein OraA/RecX
LRRKGVPNEEIAKAVRGVDEADSAYRAARPKAERLRNVEAMEFRTKLSGFLSRRGYDYQVIRNTVARLWKEMNSQERGTEEEIE